MREEAVRWSLKVTKDTDLNLRAFWVAHGAKKGGRSKFIEHAVPRRVLQCTVQDIRARSADADSDHIQSIVDGAVSDVRTERRFKQTADKACWEWSSIPISSSQPLLLQPVNPR
jgi:hypothetical protein